MCACVGCVRICVSWLSGESLREIVRSSARLREIEERKNGGRDAQTLTSLLLDAGTRSRHTTNKDRKIARRKVESEKK